MTSVFVSVVTPLPEVGCCSCAEIATTSGVTDEVTDGIVGGGGGGGKFPGGTTVTMVGSPARPRVGGAPGVGGGQFLPFLWLPGA